MTQKRQVRQRFGSFRGGRMKTASVVHHRGGFLYATEIMEAVL